MTQEEFQELLKKYRHDSCTPEEKKLMDEWFSAITTDRIPFSDAEYDSQLKNRTWSGVYQYISQITEEKVPDDHHQSAGMKWRFIGVAASIILLMVMFLFFNTRSPDPMRNITRAGSAAGMTQFNNESSGTSGLWLPDGSEITLGPYSRITFSETFDAPKREIYLEGEAYFEVSRDVNRPFLVYTMALITEVLGTSFVVKAYKQQQEIVVTVKSGKVSVYAHDSDEKQGNIPQGKVILSSNQQVIYYSHGKTALRKLVKDPQVILPQPTLKPRYTNAPVTEILQALEENYGIPIRYNAEALSHCTLTSDLSEEGFYEQIEIICNALGVTYTVADSSIIIHARGGNVY